MHVDTYICLVFMANVGNYSLHGASGLAGRMNHPFQHKYARQIGSSFQVEAQVTF